jgi:hypothetical protein
MVTLRWHAHVIPEKGLRVSFPSVSACGSTASGSLPGDPEMGGQAIRGLMPSGSSKRALIVTLPVNPDAPVFASKWDQKAKGAPKDRFWDTAHANSLARN